MYITYHKSTKEDVSTLVDNRILFALELHATNDGEKVYILEGFIHHNEPTLRRFMYENN